MNKKEVTIITAFFDIGRKNFNQFARTNNNYLNYFKFWARIKNNIVVYTDSTMAEEVKKIRKEFNLLDKTKVIVVDDITVIEPDLFNRMTVISNSQTFLKYRYMNNSADNNARYDYVMLLKTWCLNDASEKGYAEGLLCWLDFGFNHGGSVYPNELEFDFTLNANLPDDKITFFALKEDEGKPIFQIIQSYEVCIMGAIFYVPSALTSTLWNDMKSSMESLLDVGFIDDDQTIMLMASRRNKEKYNVIVSDWFIPLKEYGAEHLTVKKKNTKITFKDKILNKYRVIKRNRRYLKNVKEIFFKNNLD